MKYLLCFLAITIPNLAFSQLVNCRQKIAMVYYELHNDSIPNTAKSTILTVKPDILIDNTPGGLYGPGNNNKVTLPSCYTPHGIQVFSYITGGYEGTSGHPDTTSLLGNLSRISAIANDGSTGVFLDQVSSLFPLNTNPLTSTKKSYVQAIYDKCQSEGLKLILNTGSKDFDPWLFDRCDYLMSDEIYNGRAPTASEQVNLNKIIVISRNVTTQQAAENLTASAYNNSFTYYYPSYDSTYRFWGSWLQAYFQAIVQSQPAQLINGNTNINLGQSTSLSMPSCSYPIDWFDSPNATLSIASGPTISVTPYSNKSYYAECKKPLCSIPWASITINVNVCIDNQTIPNVLSGENKIYTAPNSLQLNSQVASGANLQIQAGGQLLLLQGTEIRAGSVFKAEIKNCNQ